MSTPSSLKQCFFCTSNIKYLDYKNAEVLKKYLSPQGKILAHKKSGVCAKHQRQLTQAIKRARVMGFLALSTK